eukprot:Nk52_evm2s805 gene=Nk52_evmTU2s805
MDERHWWIISKLQEAFSCLNTSEIPSSHYATIVENFIMQESVITLCNTFFQEIGPRMLIFQCKEATSIEEMNVELAAAGKTKLISVSDGQDQIRFTEGKGFYFIRIIETEGIPVEGFEKNVMCGEIVPPVLSSFEMNLETIYLPMFRKDYKWGNCSPDSSNYFLQYADKFATTITNTVGGINDKKITLRLPGSTSFSKIQKTSLTRTVPPDVLTQFEKCVEDWFRVIDGVLQKDNISKKEIDPSHGPNTEWEIWKQRFMDLSSILEQLRSQECKTILAVLVSAKSKQLKKWKVIDGAITDGFNEAKDNVKYLEIIKKSTEELYAGTPVTAVQALPNIMVNIKMVHNVAKYYGIERLTVLFMKITNQMIINCLHYITEENDNIWEQDSGTLVKKLQQCLHLYAKYQDYYRQTKDKVNTAIKGKSLEMNESRLFGRLDRFCFRIRQVLEVISTSTQFQDLTNHAYYPRVKKQIATFEDVVLRLKASGKDVFHFESKKGHFEMNYLSFVKQVDELENYLRKFISLHYRKVNNADIALQELQSFRKIVKRQNLKADIELKYSEIYGRDLDFVQKLYEKFKDNPPVERNSGKISGYIRWSRHLLQRIETPMSAFKQFKTVTTTREGKKIIKVYNKVASALIEFETLWHNHWIHKLESLRLSLNSPLLVKNAKTHELTVNLDYNLLEITKEARGFYRLNMDVPSQAKHLLSQDCKLRSYHDQLTAMLKRFRNIRSMIEPNLGALLNGHLRNVYSKIEPGLSVLSWGLMNIDAYLYRALSSFKKLEALLESVNAVLVRDVWSSLKAISNCRLIIIPEESCSLEEFMNLQRESIPNTTKEISKRSDSIKNALQLIIKFISSDPQVVVTEATVDQFFMHYAHLLRLALINCVKNTLNELTQALMCCNRDELNSSDDREESSVCTPLLKVDVELNVPDFGIYPSLEKIRHCVSNTVSSVLSASSHIPIWYISTGNETIVKESFYPLVVDDPNIIKSIFALSGAVESWRSKVVDYLKDFSRFSHLWTLNMQTEYNKFLATHPSVQDFEEKIQAFVNVEADLMSIPICQNIGPLCICTESLKFALKAEISSWKAKYAQNLHTNAHKALEGYLEYIKNSTALLDNQVSSLDDLKKMMKILDEVQDKDLELDVLFNPVEDMYNLLSQYSVRLPHQEIEQANELRSKWKSLKNKVIRKDNELEAIKTRFRRELEKQIKAFTVDVIQFRNDFDANGPLALGLNPSAGIRRLKNFSRLYEDKVKDSLLFAEGENLFGIPVTSYPELQKTGEDLNLLNSLYGLYSKLVIFDTTVRDTLWEKADLFDLQKQVLIFEEEDKKLDRRVKEWEAGVDIKNYIKEYQETLPVLISLSSESIKNRHWLQVMNITGKSFNLDTNYFKLSHLLDADLLRFREDLNEITIAANREMEIEVMITQIEEDWTEQVLVFENFKGHGEITLSIGEVGKLLEMLEESQITIGTMLNSKYVAPLREEVTNWVSILGTVSDVIEQWLAVQNLWMYMEAVFDDEIISKELPQETERFIMIDKNWRRIMTKAHEVPNVIQCCYGNDALKHLLQHLSDQLELCQKSLVEYLHAKRQTFPRFFFVSDPALLAMLSNTDSLETVMPHLKSIYGNVTALLLDPDDRGNVIGVQSSEGDVMHFETTVKFDGKIERMMQDLLEEMRKTLQLRISRVGKDILGVDANVIALKNECQVALIGVQMHWTQMTENTFISARTDKKAFSNASKVMAMEIQELSDVLNGKDTTQLVTKLDTLKLESVIVAKIVQRDILDELSRKRTKDVIDFEWQKHCRHYYNKDKAKVIVHIANVRCSFNHEFLGSQRRIVVTPLTEKCILALTQTVKAFQAGVPFGPPGTGKSELVKDLGFTTGNYTVVFNCTEQIDHVVLGRMIKGIVQSGSWGCFDAIQAVKGSVLSVFAEQLKCIFAALKQYCNSCNFTDGQILQVNVKCAFFMTLNTGDKSDFSIPINLKCSFRGIAMVFPETEIIVRCRLGAFGFLDARTLAKKIFIFYKMCAEHLSQQFHYDFGLRAICYLVERVICFKQENAMQVIDAKSQAAVVKFLIRELNFPRLVQEDIFHFKTYLNDTFREQGNSSAPKVLKNMKFENAINRQIEETGLIAHSAWFKKVAELNIASNSRTGVAVVGPTGCGKSKCIETLIGGLNRIHNDGDSSHRMQKISPCSVSVGSLFGYFSPARDWVDGIVSSLWRKATKTKSTVTWFCFDGPTNREWMDHISSVLDEDGVLALNNGDRLQSAGQIKLIFETTNLVSASPAAVSRSAVIYIPENCLGWKPLIDAWLKTRRSIESGVIRDLCEANMGKLFVFHSTELNPVVSTCTTGIVKTFLKLLEAMLSESADFSEGLSHIQYQRIFFFAATWAFGGLLSGNDRVKFNDFVVEISKCFLVDELHSIYDFYLDETYEWETWQSKVPAPKSIEISNANMARFISTPHSVRIIHLLSLVHKAGGNTLLTGNGGVGKSSIIKNFLSVTKPNSTVSKGISFSGITTPCVFHNFLDSCVRRRQGHIYGADDGKKLNIFIDDISLVGSDESSGRPYTCEIVRQLIEDKGVYDLHNPGEWKHISECTVIAAMKRPIGGSNDISSRLKTQFAIFDIIEPNEDSLFNQTLMPLFLTFGDHDALPSVRGLSRKLISMSISILDSIRNNMLPTIANWFYEFDYHTIANVFWRVLRVPLGMWEDKLAIAKIFLHESMRVYTDRMDSSQDIKWVKNLLQKYITETLEISSDDLHNEKDLFGELCDPQDIHRKSLDIKRFENQEYREVEFSEITLLCNKYLSLYNEQNPLSRLNIVLFEDNIRYILRISRIINISNGHCILVGTSSNGRKSLATLAAYACDHVLYKLKGTRSYEVTDFMDELRVVYRLAGFSNKKVTFLLDYSEIIDMAILSIINDILIGNGSEIYTLFKQDEMEMLLNEMKPIIKNENPACLGNPGDGILRKTTRTFSGFISGCQLIMFSPWPVYALQNIAEKVLSETDHFELEEKERKKVTEYLVEAHSVVENACKEYHGKRGQDIRVTPKTYIVFLNQLVSLYTTKREKYNSQINMMEVGLEKLKTTKEELHNMEEQLKVYQTELAQADHVAENFIANVKGAALKLEREKSALLQLQIAVAPVISSLNAEDGFDVSIMSEEQVNQANIDLLNRCFSNVGMLSKTDVDFLRSNADPPPQIKLVMDMILVILRKPLEPVCLPVDTSQELLKIEDSWNIAVQVMGDTWFLDSLINYSMEALDREIVELLEPYLGIDELTVSSVRKISEFCAVLLEFVLVLKRTWDAKLESHRPTACETASEQDLTNDAQKEIINSVNMPLAESKVSFRSEDDDIANVSAKMKEISVNITKCTEELDTFQAQYDKALSERQTIYEKKRNYETRLQSAKSLLHSLQTAKNKWITQSELYSSLLPSTLGNSLISSAFLCFCGPFNAVFREKLENDFLNICLKLKIKVKENISLVDFLVDKNTIKGWTADSLSSDRLSVENACIVTLNNDKWPLLLDPQGRGVEWIIKKETPRGLVVAKHSAETFRSQLEVCAFKGHALLIVDADPKRLWENPHIKALLLTSTPSTRLGGKLSKFLLGEKEIDCHHNFRFYMATKLNNPYIPEEFATHANIVNFIVTRESLIEHLLNNVVNHEKPDLEVERKQVQANLNALAKQAEDLEQHALGLLVGAGESFAENEDLIESLTVSKEKLVATYNTLSYTEANEREIQNSVQEYIPIAVRGAVVYEAVSEMGSVNNMYSTSLDQYLRIFHHAVETAERSPLISKRIDNIIECLTYIVYVIVSRGLYEVDKPVFLMLLSSKIARTKGDMSQEEYEFLLKGGQNQDLKSGPRKPSDWVTEETWKNIIALSHFERFHDVPTRMARYEHSWKEIIDSDTPENCVLPDGLHERLNKLQKFMILRALRTDRFQIILKLYVRDTLGKQYVQPIPLKPEAALTLCNKMCPLLAILTEESSDPVPMLEGIAKSMKKEVATVSLGSKQNNKCMVLVKEGMKNGTWVILQNAEHAIDTLLEIEKLLEGPSDSIHENFRLFILSAQTPRFPISLLHVCVRLVIEPSYHLNDCMKRCLMWVGSDKIIASKNPAWVPFLYSLCFLHSVIRSRRKFQDYGWCNRYQWGTSDLESAYMFALRQFESAATAKTTISFSSIKYAISEVVYGGRITDPYDQRILTLFVDKWIGAHSCNLKFEFEKGYQIPSIVFQDNLKFEGLLSTVNSLPLVESPEVYGLTSAAEARYRKRDAEYIFEKLSFISTKNGPEGDENCGTVEQILELIGDLKQRLPKEFHREHVAERMKKIGSLSPFGSFILREIESMRQLLALMKATLADCKSALKGGMITTEDLGDAISALSENKVPNEWTKKLWGITSFSLSAWFVDINARCDQLWNCLHKERPSSFSLGNFFSPKGLLTVVKQEALRFHTQWSMESLAINSEVTSRDRDHVREAPNEGIFIHGVYLQGAAYDRTKGQITKSTIRSIHVLPVVHLWAAPNADEAKPRERNTFSCPVYKYQTSRQYCNFVMEIDVKTEGETSKWIARGVACSLKVY